MMILQATAEVTDNLTNLTNEVTDHTNKFSFFIMILQLRLQSNYRNLTDLTNEVTEHTNEFTFFMYDLTADVTETLLIL
jgi:hypothetical protein